MQLESLLPAIHQYFEDSSSKVFRKADLTKLLKDNQMKGWLLPQTMTTPRFAGQLISHTKLKEIILSSTDNSQAISRFVWAAPSPYEVALSLAPNAYLSHSTSVFFHQLNDLIPRVIYINNEQSKRASSATSLVQSNIDKAFASKQRISGTEFRYLEQRIVLLKGKFSDNFGVESLTGPSGEPLRITNLERTLIDIAVRPGYAGGVFQVAQAYSGALDRIDMRRLMSTLEKLDYIYPYHQAIGFYLQQAGLPARRLQPLKKKGHNFDFYLDYAIPKRNRMYNAEWRLFYPKGL